MITGLDHINIRTADLAATKAFFIDVLGFTDGWRPDVPAPGAWLYHGDQALVHLVEVDEPATPSRGTSLDHFAFSIDDYDETLARLEAHGVHYRAAGLNGGTIRQLVVRDPNGVSVELNWRDRTRVST